jgi:hypothetical protein
MIGKVQAMNDYIADKAKLINVKEVYIVSVYLTVDFEPVDTGRVGRFEPVFADIKAARRYADESKPHDGNITWNDDREFKPGQFGVFRVEDGNGVVQWEYVISSVTLYSTGGE